MSPSHPLSEPQREVWRLQRLLPESCLWNIGGVIHIEGGLDRERFSAAAREVVDREEALRLRFGEHDGEPLQSTHSFPPFETGWRDVTDVPGSALDSEIRAIMGTRVRIEEGERPVRFDLFRTASDRHVFLARFHHLAIDGWGIMLLFQRLVACYNHVAPSAIPSFLSTIRPGAETVIREENFPDVERRWPFALATAGPSELHSLELSQERMRRIVSAGRRTRAAPFALFASATCDAAPTLRGGSDSGVALACPVLNRRNPVIRQTVGHFARLAVLPVSGRETLDELTHNMRERAAKIERSGCAPSAAALESAEFFLSFESHDYAHAFEGCATRSDPAVRPEQLRPVEIFVRNYGASSPVRVDFAFRGDLVDPAATEEFVEAFDSALDRLSDESHGGPRRSHAATTEWLGPSAGVTDLSCAASVLIPIETAMEHRPDALAVTTEGREWSYGDLAGMMRRAAGWLAAEGITTGSVVGISGERSVEMIACMLAVWRVGASVVPLDPRYPVERLAHMITQSKPSYLIVDASVGEVLSMALRLTKVVTIDQLMDGCEGDERAHLSGRETAYILFTSGSSGLPKGVPVSHLALSNCLTSLAREPGFSADDHMAWMTTISFDIAVAEIFLPLSVGGAVELISDRIKADARQLADTLARSSITVAQATPSLWRLLEAVDWRPPSTLRAWSGGESLAVHTARFLLERAAQLWNCYGPTETTIWSFVHRIRAPGEAAVIGRPMASTWASLREEDGTPAKGSSGELWIGGAGVTGGYLAGGKDRFVGCQFPDGSRGRAFRTGDLVRRLESGELLFQGRGDRQVKISGHRVEPAEVEAVLVDAPGVRDAMCVPRNHPTGAVRLIAYVIPSEEVKDEKGLLDACDRIVKDRLAPRSRPVAILAVRQFPVSPAGKRDPKQLPLPAGWENEGRVGSLESEAEHNLARVVRDILKIPLPGRGSTFGELGADSLGLLQIIVAAERVGLALTLSEVQITDTLAEAAARARPCIPRPDGFGATIASTARQLNSLCPPRHPSMHAPSEFPLGNLDDAILAELVPFPHFVEDVIHRGDLSTDQEHSLWKMRSVVRRLKAAPADKDARRAWRAVVNHHVVLRSSMRLFDGSWFQVIEREAMGQGELQTDSNKRRRTDEPIISAALATMEACKFRLEFPNWLLDNYGAETLIDEWESACGAEFWIGSIRQPYRNYVRALRSPQSTLPDRDLRALANWDLVMCEASPGEDVPQSE